MTKCAFVSLLTVIPSTKDFGSPSKYPLKNTCVLISTDDSDYSQYLYHNSVSPLNGSNLIVGNFILGTSVDGD